MKGVSCMMPHLGLSIPEPRRSGWNGHPIQLRSPSPSPAPVLPHFVSWPVHTCEDHAPRVITPPSANWQQQSPAPYALRAIWIGKSDCADTPCPCRAANRTSSTAPRYHPHFPAFPCCRCLQRPSSTFPRDLSSCPVDADLQTFFPCSICANHLRVQGSKVRRPGRAVRWNGYPLTVRLFPARSPVFLSQRA